LANHSTHFSLISVFATHGSSGRLNPKSEDGGETWMLLNEAFYFNSDATVYDVAVGWLTQP
jgi:hypothetical protein